MSHFSAMPISKITTTTLYKRASSTAYISTFALLRSHWSLICAFSWTGSGVIVSMVVVCFLKNQNKNKTQWRFSLNEIKMVRNLLKANADTEKVADSKGLSSLRTSTGTIGIITVPVSSLSWENRCKMWKLLRAGQTATIPLVRIAVGTADHRGQSGARSKGWEGLPHWGWVPGVIGCWQIKVRGHRKHRKDTHAHTHARTVRRDCEITRQSWTLWTWHDWLKVSKVTFIHGWRND